MAYDIKLSEGFTGQRSVDIPKIILESAKSDPLLSLLHLTAIGYYPKAKNHYRHRSQPIEENILIYCSDGEGWFDINGKYYEVKTNTFFILPAGSPHTYGANKDHPWTIYWIHFSGASAKYYAAGCQQPRPVRPSADSRIRNRTELFDEIFTVLDRTYNIDGMKYAVSLFHHYIGTLLYLSEYRKAQCRREDQDIVNATIHYMEENIERPLTLQILSDYSGLSISYLSTLIKERTGHPPLAYLNLIKIKQACRLLNDTDMQVNTICHKVGFQDPYYFTRIFKKHMGMSPTSYRHSSKI